MTGRCILRTVWSSEASRMDLLAMIGRSLLPWDERKSLGPWWWFQILLIFIPTWGRFWHHFDEHIFQVGWNHQLVGYFTGFLPKKTYRNRTWSCSVFVVVIEEKQLLVKPPNCGPFLFGVKKSSKDYQWGADMIYMTRSKIVAHRNQLNHNDDIQLVSGKRNWLKAISRERDIETLGIFTGDLLISPHTCAQ